MSSYVAAQQQGQQLQSLLPRLHRLLAPFCIILAHSICTASQLKDLRMVRCRCRCWLSPAPLLQAALHDVVCVGVTPRELSMMALSALTAWRSSSSQQQSGLLPQHVASSIRGWMAQHDSRVSGQ